MRVAGSLRRCAVGDAVLHPIPAALRQDDLYGTYENARYTAQQIRGAKFVSFPSGGHVWLGHDDEVWREVARFVTESTRVAPR